MLREISYHHQFMVQQTNTELERRYFPLKASAWRKPGIPR
jgi:hypothetical protein